MLKADGFDKAIIGMATIWRDGSKVDVLVYSGNKMASELKKDGMTYEQAVDFIEKTLSRLVPPTGIEPVSSA